MHEGRWRNASVFSRRERVVKIFAPKLSLDGPNAPAQRARQRPALAPTPRVSEVLSIVLRQRVGLVCQQPLTQYG